MIELSWKQYFKSCHLRLEERLKTAAVKGLGTTNKITKPREPENLTQGEILSKRGEHSGGKVKRLGKGVLRGFFGIYPSYSTKEEP